MALAPRPQPGLALPGCGCVGGEPTGTYLPHHPSSLPAQPELQTALLSVLASVFPAFLDSFKASQATSVSQSCVDRHGAWFLPSLSRTWVRVDATEGTVLAVFRKVALSGIPGKQSTPAPELQSTVDFCHPKPSLGVLPILPTCRDNVRPALHRPAVSDHLPSTASTWYTLFFARRPLIICWPPSGAPLGFRALSWKSA